MAETPTPRPVPTPPIGSAEGELEHDPRKLVRWATPTDRKRPHPLYCVWEITLECDLGCRHCGSRAGDARPGELDTEACLGVVKELADMGVREVTLIGGEAYLREDWDVIASEITRRGMVCSMTTGARNLTQARVARAVKAGMRTISVSIDGLERTHDAVRGSKGSWKAAVEASRCVAASPIRLATNTQINRLSMPELPAIADLMADIGSQAWQIQLTVAMGRGADRPELLLQPHELLELFPLLVWIKRQKLLKHGIRLFPGNNIGYFGPYEHLLRYGGEMGAHWASCAAGEWSIGLEADGKIKGCPSLPSDQYTGGMIGEIGIAQAIAESEPITFIRERTLEDLWRFCRTCYYADVCKAGCTWTSTCFFGKAGNNPYCIHRAMEHEKQGLRERIRKLGPAPGLPFDHGMYEVVTEPAPEADTTPSIAGVDLQEVISMAAESGGAWAKDAILERLSES